MKGARLARGLAGSFSKDLMTQSSPLLVSALTLLLPATIAVAQPTSAPGAEAETSELDDEAEQATDEATDQATDEATDEAAAEAALAAAAAAAKPSKSVPLEVSYDKGIVMATADESFKVRLGMRAQLRFESTRQLEDGAEVTNRFYIPRSRLQLEGNLFGEGNRYKLELGLGDRGSFSYVRDFYVDKAVGPAWLRAGLWKRPFNRHEIVSDFSSQFNERANTAEFVGGGRDLGVGLHNEYEKSPQGLEWVIGVFNGFSGGNDRPVINTRCTDGDTSISCTTAAPSNFPTDWGPAIVARVGWSSPDMKGYSEGDLEGGPLRYAVGASYKIDLADFDQGSQSSLGDNLSHGAQVDAMIKVSGLSLQLGGYMMKLKAADASFGVLAQGGVFVLPKRGELAARFSLAPTSGDRDQIEVRGAFNWYWEGHRYKWSTDFGMVKQTGSDPTTMAKDDPDLLLRSMLQLSF
jgi:phosphate-selective porin OprO and OprP